jgi:hypothetical protein
MTHTDMKNKLLSIVSIIFALVVGVLLLNNPFYRSEKIPEITEEPFLDGEIHPLYFFSYGAASTTVKCVAAKNIDWDIAIVALSDYMEYGAGATSGEESGPAEIQRHFEENCERDMKIYTDVVTKNPELLQRDK